MRKQISLILFLILSISAGTFAQYKISISAPQFQNGTLLFGHYFNESIMIQDTFYLNDFGKGIIEGKKNLPEGMYTVYFPNTSRLDLLIDKDQMFSLSVDSTDLAAKTEIKGSEENELFYEYLNYLNLKRKEAESYKKILKEHSSPQDSILAKEKLDLITADVKKYIDQMIKEHADLFLSKFLLALKEIEVPDFPKDENGHIIDSSFQVKYYKKHYFDYFDLSDVRLLRSPLYQNKLMTYLDRWIYPNPDSIYREVDMLIEKSRTDTLLFKYMLTTLFNYYAKSKYIGMDAIYAYIGDKYYIPEASWADSSFITDLKERIKKITPLIIGSKGPDIRMVSLPDEHFKKAANDTTLKKDPYKGSFFNLYDIEADFTILYFWESDCGHCKKTIPILHELYQELKEYNVEVIAVSMLGGVEGKVKWVDFINEHSIYGWINAWNPYDYSYRDAYDVTSSNIMYLLDKDKTIIAKRIGPEQALEIIKFEAKKNIENE
jgi:thiol-disulfide isomerase/thioredoxin